MRQRRFVVIPVVAALAVTIVVVGVAFALTQVGKPASPFTRATAAETPLPDKTLPASDGSVTVEASTLVASEASTAVEIEVPSVVGKQVAAAEALLQAAGFKTLTRVSDTTVTGAAADEVISQWPNSGSRLHAGERVTITYQPAGAAAAAGRRPVVVIDAGHQTKGDLSLEPIGPGSKVMKAKVTGGATGVTRPFVPEYKRTLEISLKLRDYLEARGVKVVMVRTSNAVNIPNSERAKIGNREKADLVVRVHLDSSTDGSVHGISSLYPSGNAWCKPIEARSKKAAALVEDAVTAATGAKRRGLFGRSDMTGFNWSTQPTIIVECGFMSNADEDRRIANPAYRDKIASGLATGVLAYLNSD